LEANALRQALNRAGTWNEAARLRGRTGVKITNGLPAPIPSVESLVPHVYMEGIYLVEAEVNENPGLGKVSGSLQLGQVDGPV